MNKSRHTTFHFFFTMTIVSSYEPTMNDITRGLTTEFISVSNTIDVDFLNRYNPFAYMFSYGQHVLIFIGWSITNRPIIRTLKNLVNTVFWICYPEARFDPEYYFFSLNDLLETIDIKKKICYVPIDLIKLPLFKQMTRGKKTIVLTMYLFLSLSFSYILNDNKTVE